MRFDRRGMIGGGLVLAMGLPFGRAFAATADPVINKIVLEDHRVWIAAMIEEKGPYFFIVDTGGVLSFIDDSFAKSIGLQKVKGRQMFGMGGKVADYSWYVAKELRLASGIRFPDMLFAGIGKRVSKDAVGALGAGMFTTYDSDLDFVKGEWRAYTKGRPNFDGLTKLRSHFTKDNGGQRIQVDATIDGYSGDFLVDTGAPGINLTGRASANSGLWDDTKPFAPTRIGGIGDGSTPARVMRAKKTQVGPFVFEDLLVTLNKPGTSSSDHEGILGLSVLSLLDLTTDVSGTGSLWCKPNGLKPDRNGGGYPLSGLWLDDIKGRIVVSEIGTGSPALLAGLRKGDVLVGGDLRTMIATINGGPGKQVSLKVERGGVQSDITYTLKPWL